MFNGIQIIQVEPGTVIEGPNGKKLTVTDESAVFNGPKCWVTAKIYEALKKQVGNG